MELPEILTYIGSGSGIVAFLWTAANWSSKRKQEKAAGDLAEAEADGKVGDNWRSYAETLQSEINSINERFEEERKKRDEERRQMDEERKAWAEERADYQEANTALKREIKRLEGIITVMEKKFGVSSAEVANG